MSESENRRRQRHLFWQRFGLAIAFLIVAGLYIAWKIKNYPHFIEAPSNRAEHEPG